MLATTPFASFLSLNTRKKLHFQEKRLRRVFRSNKRLVIATILLYLVLHYSLSFIRYQFNYNSKLDFQLGEEYKGTYKEKYLNSLTSNDDIYTNEFYNRLKLMDYLDDLLKEKIEGNITTTQDPYELLSSNYPDFSSLPLAKQSDIYLNQVLIKSHFKFEPHPEQIYRDVYNEKNYIKSRLQKWLKIKKILTEDDLKFLGLDADEFFENSIIETRNAKIEFNNKISHQANNNFKNIRFFSKFFLKQGNLFDLKVDEATSLCRIYQNHLFPWLLPVSPKFTKFKKNGDILKDNLQPYADEAFETTHVQPEECFIKVLQAKSKGRGIVITATDSLLPELTGLLSVLRALNNHLPIQIVHNGMSDLSKSSIKKIMEVATEPVMKLPESFKKTSENSNLFDSFLGSGSGNTAGSQLKSTFPVQDITFVDVSKSIHFQFKSVFGHWGMKLLALLFNSFEDMIMLDTDTVPLQQIDAFFESKAFKETQTSFFRDREANSFLYDGIIDFFLNFLTTENDTKFLGLAKPSEQVLSNRFFQEKARHFMESGLFLMNRKTHFDGILTSVQMQFYKLITGSVHGEKELIWLGQQIAGNDNYQFNSNPAAAVGELSPKKDGIISNELCSTHPGHLADDGKTLLWFNSGFLNCKKVNAYYKDINYKRNKGLDLQGLRKKYLSPLKITNILIPPPAEYEVEFIENESEPSRGWVMTSECENYLWCGYDVIGGGSRDGEVPRGKLIDVSPQDTTKYGVLGDIWVTYYLIGKRSDGRLSSLDMGLLEDEAYDELNLDDNDDDFYNDYSDEVFGVKKKADTNKPSTLSSSSSSAKSKTNNQYNKGGFAQISNDNSENEPEEEIDDVSVNEEEESDAAKAVPTGVPEESEEEEEDTEEIPSGKKTIGPKPVEEAEDLSSLGKKKASKQAAAAAAAEEEEEYEYQAEDEHAIDKLLSDDEESQYPRSRDHDIIISDEEEETTDSDKTTPKSAKSKGFKVTDDFDLELESYDSFETKKSSSSKGSLKGSKGKKNGKLGNSGKLSGPGKKKTDLNEFSKEEIQEAASKLIVKNKKTKEKEGTVSSSSDTESFGSSLNDFFGKMGFGGKYSESGNGAEVQEIQKEGIENAEKEKEQEEAEISKESSEILESSIPSTVAETEEAANSEELEV